MIATAETDTEGHSVAKQPRILVAVEPRSYAEAIGRVIQALRPQLEVTVVEPDDLMLEVVCLNPALVICSRPKISKLDDGRLAWVEFCPYERPAARISTEGRYSEMEEVELADLLSLVDELAVAAEAG